MLLKVHGMHRVRRIIALLDMDRPEDIYKEDEEAGVVQPKYTYVCVTQPAVPSRSRAQCRGHSRQGSERRFNTTAG